MRLTLAAIALTALTTDGAVASSFVYVTQSPGANTPSFVTVAPLKPMAAAPLKFAAVAGAATGERLSDLIPLAYPLSSDTAEPVVKMVAISKSIIAFESSSPAVTFEKVAAIASAIKARLPTPMVMRGGIIGGAFGTPEPEAAAPRQPQENVKSEVPAEGGPAVASNSGPPESRDGKTASRSDAPPQPTAPASPEEPQAAAPPSDTRKTFAPQ